MDLLLFRCPQLIIKGLNTKSDKIVWIIEDGIILSEDRVMAVYPYQDIDIEKLIKEHDEKGHEPITEIFAGYSIYQVEKALCYLEGIESAVNFISDPGRRCFPMFIHDFEIIITVAPRIVDEENKKEWEKRLIKKVNNEKDGEENDKRT